MPGVCTVCAHAQRKDIDAAIIAAEPLRGIARRFRASDDALGRPAAGPPRWPPSQRRLS